MDKQEIEARLKCINDRIAQYQAEYNALIGAKSECEYWLSELAKKECVVVENDNGEQS